MVPNLLLAAICFGATFASSADGNELQSPENFCLLQIGLNVSTHSAASKTKVTEAKENRSLPMRAQKLDVQSSGNASVGKNSFWASLHSQQQTGSTHEQMLQPASNSTSWLPWTMTDCRNIAGVPKLKWAIVCDVLALILVFLCIPFLLMCSRRRPPGAPVFSCNCGS